VADDGSIYVADTWNYRIQHLSPTGELIGYWGSHGEHPVTAQGAGGLFFGPRGIAVGEFNRIYVADTGNKRVQVFNASGQLVSQWGGGGVHTGQLDEPVGIAVAPNGTIYVADTWNQRIQAFSNTGNPILEWPVNGWDTYIEQEKPYLAIDDNGYIYVTDPGNHRILVFSGVGEYLASFGGFDMIPIGIAIGPDGSVYVSDDYSDQILVFDALDLTAETAD